MSSFVKVSESEVTSATSSVTLTGIDSTNNYCVIVTNFKTNTAGGNLTVRVTSGGTAQSGANYDRAGKQLKNNAAFNNAASSNNTHFTTHFANGTNTGSANNCIYYLYQFYGGSSYAYVTAEEVGYDQNGVLIGNQAGVTHTVGQSNDGLYFYSDAGSISSGVFTLYRIEQ